MRISIVFLLCLLMAGVAFAEVPDERSLAGLWRGVGEAEQGAMRFDVDLSFEQGSLQGVFVLVDEGGVRVPAETVEFVDGVIGLTAMGGAVELRGSPTADEVAGTLRTPGGQMPMRLARDGSAAARAMMEEVDQKSAQMRSEALERIRSGPAMDAVDAGALAELLDAADASYTTALALIHDGELVGEWHRGDGPEPIHAMSVTKVALHLLIGRLITLGELESIDVPVHHFYPQWAEDQQRAAITIRHLLAHASGLDRGQPAGPIYQSDDFVQFALDAPLEFDPGTAVAYSNNATNLLGGIVGQIVDRPLDKFLADDLFGLLGIDDFAWDTDPAGNPQGMAGLQLTAGDLARLGQLALDYGRWQGDQLIDRQWFEDSFVPATEHSERLGLIWFLEHEEDEVVGAFHSGYLGQWLSIRFDKRLVGVRMVANTPAYDGQTDGFRDFVEYLPALVE